MYHLFIQQKGNGTVVKPVMFVYPEDPVAYSFEVENS